MTLATLAYTASAIVSVLFLWKGADWLVDAAARIAGRFHVPELVIGLTLVAAGTSAPEFAVSIEAALQGKASISVGNVIGSNVFNLGFILGGCAMIRPILTSAPLVYRDGVVLLGSTVMLLFFLSDDDLSRWEGLTMMVVLGLYLTALFFSGRRGEPLPIEHEGSNASEPPDSSPDGPVRIFSRVNLVDFGILALGITLVVGGSRLLVFGASGLAESFGISQWVIGLTIVAAGTSAPELVTTLAATLKDRHGISAGSLVGSDIYNLLGVLGVAAFIHPMHLQDSAGESTLMLVAMVVLVLVMMRTRWRLARWQGGVLVGINVVRWYFEFASKA